MRTLSIAQQQRYARHLVLEGLGAPGQQRLLDAGVLVIGAGGLGSAALLYLAAAGVGRIGIVDDDCVDVTNLQRQVIHRMARVGEPKAVSAAEAVRSLNPDVQTDVLQTRATPDNILSLLAPYDIVLDATDRFGSKFLISDACVLAQKPFVHAGVVTFSGQILTYVPGQGPCLRCLLEQPPAPEDAPTCAQIGVLGAAVGVMGSLQAAEAIKYLTGAGTLLTGRMLYVDTLQMEMRTVPIGGTSPHCPVCHADRTDDPGRWLQAHRADYETPASL